MTQRRHAERNLFGLVAVIMAVTSLAGCTSIPRSGPVVVGQTVSADPQDGVLQAILEGPTAGQTPEEVVRGFIGASVGFGDDHRIARSFLAPSKRLQWNPDASAEIYPGRTSLVFSSTLEQGAEQPEPSASFDPPSSASPDAVPSAADAGAGPVQIIVTTPVTGLIDGTGRYSQAAPGQTRTREFTLIRSEGDWRIEGLDDGILVSSSDFAVTFRSYPVYFSDPARRYLVPDVHWLPANRDDSGLREVPTALVGALLSGPSPYLRGAVISGAPAGTRMAVAAVVVTDQVATVDLTEQVLRIPTRDKQVLLAQLRATLGIGSISGVQITVRRTPLDIPDQPEGPSDAAAADGGDASAGQPQVDPQVDGDPVAIDSTGHIARLSGTVLTAVDGVDGLAVPGANRPALSADLTAYAVLNGDRSRMLLQLPSGKAATLVRGTELSGPSFDPWGWVWTSDRSAAGRVSAARLEPGRVKVGAPWLKDMSVVALRVSREGARALIAVEQQGQAHIFVAGVIRDENGQPVELTQPIGVLPDLETVTDASWLDEDQIVVLGQRADRAGVQPWIVQIGGLNKPTQVIEGAESISGANGELGLMVGTEEGTMTRVGRSWTRISKARWATYAG